MNGTLDRVSAPFMSRSSRDSAAGSAGLGLRADRRRANAQLQAVDGCILGLPFGEHLLAVMRLDPGPQESRRHRQPNRAVFRGVQLHAAEPAGEDILAELITELVLDPLPALPVRARHFSLLFFFEGQSSTEQLRRGRPHHAGTGKRN
jgi:hypothetical protein